MNVSFRSQLLIYVCLIPVLVFITKEEWQKLGFLNFSNAEADAYIEELAARIPEIPNQYGEWEFVAEAPMDAGQIQIAKITKYFSRTYRNVTTNEKVTLFLATGPTSDISYSYPGRMFPRRRYAAGLFRAAV
ncbi:MAG: exosortase-associated EpsI family protein [Pirellulales bacterium]